jgi:mono/diheme cytochrome c family protein
VEFWHSGVPGCIFWFRHFTAIQRPVIAYFTLTLLCISNSDCACLAQSKQSIPASHEKSKELYDQLCLRCHAANGKGDPGWKTAPDFTRRAWQDEVDDARLIVSILRGRGTEMPGFSRQLNKSKAKALVAYIRAFAPTRPQPVAEGALSNELDTQMQQLQGELRNLQAQQKELAASTRKSDPPSPIKAPTLPPTPANERPAITAPKETPAGKQPPQLAADVSAPSTIPKAVGGSTTEIGPNKSNELEMPRGQDEEDDQEEDVPDQCCLQHILRWLGRFHSAAVHLPLGLLRSAAAAEFLFFVSARREFGTTSRGCVWFAALTAPVAAALGWFLAGGQMTDHNWVLTLHRWMGTMIAICTLIALVLVEVSCRRWPLARGTYRLTLIFSASLALATGFFGGALIHGLNYYAWPL